MVYSLFDSKGEPLEKKIYTLFNKKKGFFIELGANDGLTQSNTAFLEKEMEWNGILIEPSLKSYENCKINRPKSICLNYACVSNDFKKEYIEGDFRDNYLMASVNGKRMKSSKDDLVKVKATTLEKILDEYCHTDIDFLSLDTEGYELDILKGMNLDKYRPTYMLIEIYKKDYNKIINYLNLKDYTLHSNFTNYNKKDNRRWDGKHNDYLFMDNK